jgi:hypothetical protein
MDHDLVAKLLADAAARGRRYVRTVEDRPVAPGPQTLTSG